jgi:hypothetical protein
MVTDPPYGVNYDPAWRNQAGRSINGTDPADCGRSASPLNRRTNSDKSRLLAVLGISEDEYVARYTSVIQTDWVMRCTARKVLRTAEQEPVVLPPAKAQRAA